MPLYMGSVNGNDKAGDYYAVRSTITPHNQTMWNPYVASHGLDKNKSLTAFMFQATALGAEFGGEQFRGFVELGVGEKGLLCAGLRYKF